MFSPRWRKVFRDLFNYKMRTFLVVLSIAVGVLGVGVVTQTFSVVSTQMERSVALSNPAAATLTVGDFDDELVQTVRRMPGIEWAEGQAITGVTVQMPDGSQKTMQVYAVPDFNDIRIDKIFPVTQPFGADPTFGAERGTWPPGEHEILFEQSSLDLPGILPPGLQVGGTLETKSGDKERALKIAGLAHQPLNYPAPFRGSTPFGFVNLDTFEWLTGSRRMNLLVMTVSENKLDQAHIKEVAAEVRKKIEGGGRTVYGVAIPQPGRHWAADLFNGIALLLNLLGYLAAALAAFLIVNTIAAQIGGQIRQIGMMKAIGARSGQLVVMYMVLVLFYGLLAFLIAAPLSAFLSREAANYLAGFINTTFPDDLFVPSVVVLQAVIALTIPLIVGIVPVWTGTRISVREAISDYGLGSTEVKARSRGLVRNILSLLWRPFGFILRWAWRIVTWPLGLVAARISRPLRLSLRNTIRRRGRLALTLITLVLGGTIFMAVFNVRASMLATLDYALQNWQFDVLLGLEHSYRTDLVNQVIAETPGIVRAESWGMETVTRVRADDTESVGLSFFAPPIGTQMVKPDLIEGRWLLPEDENAWVISNAIVQAEPDLKVGQTVTLKIGEKKTDWVIVGIVRSVGQLGGGLGVSYVNYPYYASIAGQVGRTGVVQFTTEQHDLAFQKQVQKDLTARLENAGVRAGFGITVAEIKANNELFFNIIIGLLLIMSVLMAIVGGLGLMGTMTLNVLERTREIGVMRAIGASDGAVQQIFIVEGVLIGLISWAFSALLSAPLGQGLGLLVGFAIFQFPLSQSVSTDGIVMWLVIVVILSAMASFVPARRASKLTVREVLAYE